MTTGPTLPPGFQVGHWSDEPARTGCTVVIPPAGTRGGVDVRGGGTGTRELEALSPLANAEGPNAVLLTGGSAFGLGAADGVVRWLEERGIGRPTPAGVVPLVPTAVVFDLAEGEPGRRPGGDDAYAACLDARQAGGRDRGAGGQGRHRPRRQPVFHPARRRRDVPACLGHGATAAARTCPVLGSDRGRGGRGRRCRRRRP